MNLPRQPLGPACLGAVWAGLLSSCTAPSAEEARAAWLVEVLLADNAPYLGREPAPLQAKLAQMAAHPYDWMRGSLRVWLLDQSRPGGDRVPSVFGLEGGGSVQVLLVGDPHPENLGTFLPGPGPGPTEEDPAQDSDTLRVELNDYDAAAWGPWVLDLRRAGVGLTLFAVDIESCDRVCLEAALEALARSYARVASGEASFDAVGGEQDDGLDGGRFVRELVEEADEEGRERKRHNNYADADEEGELWFVEGLDEAGEGLIALSLEEQAQVERLFAAYREAGASELRLRDAARRYGAGISSLPAIRYLLLVDGGEAGPADDDLLQLRELLDPPALPGLQGSTPGLFASQAERAAMAPRLLGSRTDLDALLGGMSDGAMTFKATSASSWFQGLERDKAVEDWEEGKAGPEDLAELGAALGATLAAAHRRGPGADGGGVDEALEADLAGRVELLVDEVVQAGLADAERAELDRALLEQALQMYGPVLGAESFGTGVDR